MRNLRHDRWPAEAVEGLRVVSVGNLAVGGTGKTPLTAWVAREIRAQGVPVAVVTSGYGEDEVMLHRRWHADIPVYADRDRSAALRRARRDGAEVAVLDDGFQHRAVARNLDILLLAAEHPFPGHVMPRGRFREPPEALRRADVVVVTRRTASAGTAREWARAVEGLVPGIPTAGVALVPDRWMTVQGETASTPEGPLLAVAGVARPETFEAAVRGAVAPGTAIELRAFPDHHVYSDRNLRQIIDAAAGRTIVATEKDAVKLARLPDTPASARVLSSRAAWDWGEHTLTDLLAGVLGGGVS
jgi:tetraacyldisaccharide 4'-kinase